MITYKCAMCQQIFEKGWTDEEAKAELKENFGRENTDDCELVCDDCFKGIEVNAVKSYAELRAKSRKDMANLYRSIRKSNPAAARILYIQGKEVTKALTDAIMYGVGHVESSFNSDVFTVKHVNPKLD